jgi:hypothetical protein
VFGLVVWWFVLIYNFLSNWKADNIPFETDILWWNSSQNITTWDNKLNDFNITYEKKDLQQELKNLDKKEKTILNVYLPEHFLHSGLLDLKEKLLETKNIEVIYQTENDMNIYKHKLKLQLSTWNSEIDIFLISTDIINTFEPYWLKLQFKQDISSFFSYVFKNIFDKNYTFIPYTIDPYISLVSKNANIINSNDELNIKNLRNEILTSQKSTWKSQMKILFGVWNYDISLLKKWKESYNNYFNFFYEFVHQWYLSKNPEWIKFMLDFGNDKVYKTWNLWTMYKYVKKFTKHNKNCKYYPDICLITYKIWKIKFWLLSDFDIIDKHFVKSPKDWKDFEIYNFPITSNQYPVLWRWFMINKKTDNLLWTSIFINSYMKEWINWNIFMWKNTLSAFNNIFNRQISNKKYNKINNYINNFKLVFGSLEKQKNFIENTKIIDVLSWNISIKFFLDQLNSKLF